MAKQFRIKCVSCGARLSVPVSAVGKKAKCPACDATVVVPPVESGRDQQSANRPHERKSDSGGKSSSRRPSQSVPTDDEFGADDFFADANTEFEQTIDEDFYSDEDFDSQTGSGDDADSENHVASSEPNSRSAALPPRRRKKTKSRKPRIRPDFNASEPPSIESRTGRPAESRELTPSDIILCLICSGLGCVIGIIRLCTDNQENGRKMILLSFVVPLILLVLGIIFEITRLFGG